MAEPSALRITYKDLTLLTERHKPFSARGWIFELKYDGWRMLAVKSGATMHLWTRRGKELIHSFPELSADLAKLPDLALDGELVMLDENGRPQFEAIAPRAARRDHLAIELASRATPAAIFAFDLLMLDGKDLRAQPLLKRKAALKKVLGRKKRILYLDHVGEQGEKLFAAVEGLGLEGIVAKRADSTYRAGRSKDWVKIKTEAGRAAQAKRSEAWNG